MSASENERHLKNNNNCDMFTRLNIEAIKAFIERSSQWLRLRKQNVSLQKTRKMK